MATEDLEYSKNLVDEAEPGFERIDPNCLSPTGAKMLSDSIAGGRNILHKREGQSMGQKPLLSYFKKLPWPSSTSATATLSQQP